MVCLLFQNFIQVQMKTQNLLGLFSSLAYLCRSAVVLPLERHKEILDFI